MVKLKTLGEKQAIRYRMVYLAFGFLIAIPVMAMILLLGVDPSSAAGIFSTAAGTFGAVIIGHFATAPKDDEKKEVKDVSFLNPLKIYIVAGLTAVVGIFIAVFNARGSKIATLEKEVSAKDTQIQVATEVVKAEKKVAEFIADNRVAKAIAEGEDAKNLDKYDPNIKFYL